MTAAPADPGSGITDSPAETACQSAASLEGGVRRNAAWLLFQRGVELTVRFFIGAWLVRYLGPEQFGIYAYSVAYVALFAEFAALGLDQIVVRELARGNRDAGEIMATAVALRIIAAVVAFVLASSVALFGEADLRVRLAIMVVAGQLLLNPALVGELWFQAQLSSKYVVWTRTAVTILIATIQVLFILGGFPLLAFAWLLVLQSALSVGGLYIAFRSVGPDLVCWRVSLRSATSMLKNAWPLLVSGLSVAIYMRIDQVMLGRMVGIAAVGTYGAAVKLSELWYVVPTALAVSSFPGIVALREHGSSDVYHQRMQALYDGVALYSYGVIAGVWLLAPVLVQLLFGSEFSESASVLRVHVVSLLFVSLGVVFVRWLTVEGLMLFAMISTCVGALTNVLLNVWLIPSHGVVGAAWSTVISCAAATFAAPIMFSRPRQTFAMLSRALSAPLRIRAIMRIATVPQRAEIRSGK